jgi:predicted nucleic acid-binding protein
VLDSSFAKNGSNVSTNERTAEHAEMSKNGWIEKITHRNIELVPLTSDAVDAAADLREQYEALNVFDGVYLGSAAALDEPIVSTDTLFPEISEVEHVDPRQLD